MLYFVMFCRSIELMNKSSIIQLTNIGVYKYEKKICFSVGVVYSNYCSFNGGFFSFHYIFL